MTPVGIRKLTEHITLFSLGGIREIRKQAAAGAR